VMVLGHGLSSSWYAEIMRGSGWAWTNMGVADADDA
jgi:hypothetical protein